MQLVRLITKTQIYSIGNNLPVPSGYPIEPFIIGSMEIIGNEEEDDDGGQIIRMVCVPDEDAANLELIEENGSFFAIPRLKEMENRRTLLAISSELFNQKKDYNDKAYQALEDDIVLVVDVPVGDEMRFEYIAKRESLDDVSEPGSEPEPGSEEISTNFGGQEEENSIEVSTTDKTEQ